MKSSFVIVFFFVSCRIGAQVPINATCNTVDLPQETLNFDDTLYNNRIFIDTVSLAENIWQIGSPSKPFFTSAFSNSYCLITDTTNSYSVNNRSEAQLTLIINAGGSWGIDISGYSKLSTDSLNDGGTIEWSGDSGVTWHNALAYNSFFYDMPYSIADTIESLGTIGISGGPSSQAVNGWDYFRFEFSTYSTTFPDTVVMRFVFASDSTFDNLGGWAIDSLRFFIWCMSIDEYNSGAAVKIVPNPSAGWFEIQYEPGIQFISVQLLSMDGRIIREYGPGTQRFIVSDLTPGTYFVLVNTDVGIISRKLILAQ